MSESNPLIATGGLPAFARIEPGHVEPAMESLLRESERDLAALERDLAPTWEGIVEPLERIGDRLHRTWGTVGHLLAVKNSDALRAVYEKVQPAVVRLSMQIAQSPAIYAGLLALRDDAKAFAALDGAQRRIVDSLIRDARLLGVGLEGAARERFNEIQLELAELATRFGNHLLDATKSFHLDLRERDEVAGLPKSLLELAAQTYRSSDATDAASATAERGPWRITLDFPSLGPFLEHGRRRDLREKLYRASVTKASAGDTDNRPLIDRILALRREEAQLLGYATYAELSLASKMAPGVDEVEALLEELRVASFHAAESDLADLRAHAAAQGAPESSDLALWDIAFFAERLREARYAYSEEDLRPYFPLPKVLDGLFGLAERLFGVRIEPADGDAETWHGDVRFFRVKSDGGEPIAAFYLDPYSRPSEKRGGAWMDECVGRTRLFPEGALPVRLPVAYLVCNGTPPVDGKPSLMSFREVETLFHEFGHGLQHMLTRVDFGLASGIRNIEWDAVELPSQFMENWCFHADTLIGLSSHVETGEKLPKELFEKIKAARTYRAGSQMLRQLYFAFLDLELHHRFEPGQGETTRDVQRRIAARTTVIPPLPEDEFLCSFQHIFGGGYAAGYYSYKWAEVLSADAFGAFEEAGLEDDHALIETGRRFRETVLALGGSLPPMEVFVAFRGREPSTEALLRHAGLT